MKDQSENQLNKEEANSDTKTTLEINHEQETTFLLYTMFQ